MTDLLSGETVLLTGAGGSIGSALANTLGSREPKVLILLDHSESALSYLESRLGGNPHFPPCIFIVGNVCDANLLLEIWHRYAPTLVYHAAAFKDVPLMEANPIAAVWNNTIGTYTLAKIAHTRGVDKFTLISTDKAVNPRSIMGASKRIAELATLRWQGSHGQIRIVRLGNVLESQGSVMPKFRRQISTGGPVTVTHSDTSRYFLTLEQAVETILRTSVIPGDGGIFVPELGDPVKILNLASQLIEEAGSYLCGRVAINITGLRPGDKLTEDLKFDYESLEPTAQSSLFRVNGSTVDMEAFDRLMAQLMSFASRRCLSEMLEVVEEMIPEYLPSESLLDLAGRVSVHGL
jgi:FlaA1/EpsC-like NDP-sugar epimerase